MARPEWIETKKECEVTETGALITKRVTLERTNRRLEKKDRIDISLRFLGLAAIFIPLWLFFQQQQSERDKQKALFQLDLYSNTTSELHSMLNRPMNSHEFELSKNKILYELYPKVVLLNDKAVIDSFRVIKDMIAYTVSVEALFQMTDSLHKYYNGGSYPAIAVLGTMSQLKSSLESLLHTEHETIQGRSYAERYRGNQQKSLNYLNGMYNQLTKYEAPDAGDTSGIKAALSLTEWLYDSNNETVFHALMDSLNAMKTAYPRDFVNHMSYITSALDSTMIRSNTLLYKH